MMPPRKPVCVFTIARYGNIWRNFDRGLYQFMLRQIYIPFLQIKGKSFYLKYIFALLMPFAFVLLWHGTSNKHLIWVSCSIIELAIEKIGYTFGKTRMWMDIKKYIGLANAYRLKAAFCLLTVVPGLFGIISFILPPQNGGYICYKILFDGIIGIISGEWMRNIVSPGFCFLYLMIFSYFYSHSCLYFEEKENVKRKKKIE
uniref:MBOAT family protein n=1 Tax=Strongyloides papillosus TaxID=174720 RepID=A0A0N5BCJ8_STREA